MSEMYLDILQQANKQMYETIRDIRAKLTAVERERDALIEAQRWVPVEERLPIGDCHPVYRYEDEHIWTEDYFCRIEFEGSIVFDAAVFDVNKGKWFRFDYDGSPIELNVTHWHLLPAPIERQTK